jgi:DNA repair protein RadC
MTEMALRFGAPTFRIVRESPGTYRHRPRIETADDAYAILRPLAAEAQEVFVVLLLYARGRALGVVVVSRGTLTATLVHPREIFAPAIETRAASIIIAHNHPTGSAEPSDEDLELTERLIAAGELLGIPVLDSMVIGDGEF